MLTKGFLLPGKRYFYDPLTEWLLKTDFVTIRWVAVGFAIGNYGYACTDFYSNNIYNDLSDNANFLNDVYEFQPTGSGINEYTTGTTVTVVDVLILKNAAPGKILFFSSTRSVVM